MFGYVEAYFGHGIVATDSLFLFEKMLTSGYLTICASIQSGSTTESVEICWLQVLFARVGRCPKE